MSVITEDRKIIDSRAILVTIARTTRDLSECERSLDELARLLDTAGGEEFARVIQVKDAFEPATCIGKGKVEEIHDLCHANDISLVVFDFDLTPAQIRNLEEAFEVASVIDRSMLILDIFALHAVTGEGKLQVELAQLRYTAPRLIGKGTALSRQEGRIGTRGPGESQLESDRRHLKSRIYALEKQLEELTRNRMVMRAARDRSRLPKIAIVGYTNAGKSTLLNYLTDAGVLSEDKLFATLDPTTRRMTLPNGTEVLLTDTVGFIRKLPHHLIEAFRSTLDEAAYADLLLIVSDVTDPESEEHLAVTQELLASLGAGEKPTLYVYNKCDKLPDFPSTGIRKEENKVYISASTGQGIPVFLEMLEDMLAREKKRVTLRFTYEEQGMLSALYADAVVEKVDYRTDGIYVDAVLSHEDYLRHEGRLVHE